MDSILLDLKGVICYLDDVVVYAKDRQELEERLRKVLQRFDKSLILLGFFTSRPDLVLVSDAAFSGSLTVGLSLFDWILQSVVSIRVLFTMLSPPADEVDGSISSVGSTMNIHIIGSCVVFICDVSFGP
ncbi:hypothetical protein LAZ67_1003548 [Cordylochernes scorpioides]|uniref:Reverse transcriptase domain-containing protein n=1 Tax=Cordylochernes scorpioides TaxID=51811 RepID=A0ABY6JWX7_9ARAC|nr:hypothetical protein LAZ67_1003548 [Cordylochernes scorpioides]